MCLEVDNMEFIVNEAGCKQLSVDMLTNMRTIAGLISEIEGQDGNLKAALGDDYDAIAKSIKVMTAELGNAHSELNVIINDMNEYMSRVGQARVALN